MALFSDLATEPAGTAATGGAGLFSDLQPTPGTGLFADAAPDPQRSATPLERVLNFLATGNYASAGAARALLAGQNPVQGAVEGVQHHTTYGDILGEHGVNNPWIRLPVGFALDVALDPLTYTGFGALTKTGEAAHAATLGAKVASLSGDAERVAGAAGKLAQAGELGSTLAEQGARGQRAAVTMFGRGVLPEPVNQRILAAADRILSGVGGTQAAQELRKAFLVAPELKGIDREAFLARAGEVKAAKEIAEREAIAKLRPVSDHINGLARAHGIEPRQMARALSDAVELATPARETPLTSAAEMEFFGRVEHDPEMVAEALTRSVRSALGTFGPEAAHDLEPHVREAVAQINALNAAALKLEQDAGIKITGLTDETLNYLRHVTRPEAANQIAALGSGDIGAGISRIITEANGAAKQRGLTGLTVSQINDMAEAGRLSIAGFKPVKGGLFEENPFVATVLRAGEAGKSATSAQMLTDWARVYGTTDAKLALEQGMKKVSAPGLEALGETYFPPDIAAALQSHYQRVVQPGMFLRKWDDAQRMWKMYTLGIFPSYHTRNEMGDIWNAVILGGMHPRWIGEAAAALSGGTKLGDALRVNPERVLHLGDADYTLRELSALAEKMNVTQSGIMSDVADRIGAMRTMPRTLWESAGHAVTHNAALDLANKVGAFRENSMRLGMFMDGLSRGYSPEQAMLRVKQHLFDYQELSAFERDVLRRFFPFYAWTRNNLPLQVEALLRRPGVLAGVEKVRNEAAGPGGSLGLDNGAALPPFLEQGTPMHMGGTEDVPNFLRLSGTLPASDVELAFDPKAALQRTVGLLSPFIKSPLESATNINTFNSDLGSGDIQPMERFPGELSNFLGLPVNRRWVANELGNVRPLAELNRMNPFSVFGTDETPGLGGLGTIRDRKDADPLARAISQFSSRVYPIDAEDQMGWSQHTTDLRVRDLQHQYARAMVRGDEKNAEILRRQIEALINADAGVP